MSKDEIYQEIVKERQYQDDKWGIQHHSRYKWLAILAEEVGEANEEALNIDFNTPTGKFIPAICENYAEQFRKELIQAAAVIFAILEDKKLYEEYKD